MRKFLLSTNLASKVVVGIVAFLALSVVGLIGEQAAAQVLTASQISLDTSMVQEDPAFSVPRSITIVPVFAPAGDFNETDINWFRGLFYYLIGNERRPGFTDIPFHYVVSSKGTVFEGNSGGEERTVKLDGVDDNSLVIGYLAGKGDNTFASRSLDALGNLVIDVANRNEINLDNVKVRGVRYVQNDAEQEIVLEHQDLFGLWDTGLKSLIDQVRNRYKPVPKVYQIEVIGVELPTDKVNPLESVLGKITLKNTGKFGIYYETDSELVATKRSGNSQFYSSAHWLSQSQFGLLTAGINLLPGEEKAFDFRLRVPFEFGELAEGFEIRTIIGAKLAGSDFDLRLDVAQPAGTIVQVTDTETGWLRVRSSPSGAADEIARVSTGERFFQTDDAQNGWVQIELADGSKGWVSRTYLIYL